MKAFQFVGWGRSPEFRDVPVPKVGPGQVLVRVAGAGACSSDLHLQEFPAGALPYDLPFTLGHENAGWVEEVGAGVGRLAKGDPVLIYGPWGCGRCRPCQMGYETYCERSAEIRNAGGGLGRDGGMAPFMLVPEARWLVPLPPSLDPRLAATLADAGLTPYHAVKRALPSLPGGATAVVIGAGGLGQMGIQLLRALSGARVVALDTSEAKLATARELGADEALRPGDEAVVRIRELTRGEGAEAVIDFVGSDATLALAAKAARRMGQITIVGIGGGTLPVSFFGVPQECAIATTYWGTLPELTEVVALAAMKRIRLEAEVFPLERAPEAYQRMREGTLRGRAVIAPEG
jgi:propanol-preferring alcohol dehydrogenase